MVDSQYDQLRDLWFSFSVDKRLDFISQSIRISNTKGKTSNLIMPEFQKKWFLDGPLFEDFTKKIRFNNRVCLKIRNVGASLILIATEAVLTCWIYPKIFIPMVSATEGQATDLIKHCKNIIDNASFGIPLKGRLQDQTKTEINFLNGSTIKSFAGGNPSGIRGPRALISYLDEYAFSPYPSEVLNAVEYFHTEGGQVNILSTVYGKQNLFWKIYSDKENFVGWHRHYVTLFEDMANFDIKIPLQIQVQKYNLKLTCPWLNIDFLENKRRSDAPFGYANFLQEAVGIPVDEITAIITEEMLNTYTMEKYEIYSRKPADEKGKKSDETYIISADFGADNNMTAAVVFEAKDEKLTVCHTETFRGDFLEQAERMKGIIRRYDPEYFIGDETGMGGQAWISVIGEELTTGTVIGINYSKKNHAEEYGVDMNNKNFFITTTIRLMAEGLIITPKNHKRLREELLGMQKLVYEKTVKYTGKNGPAGADDLAMAYLQVSILYNKIFEYTQTEGIGSADVGKGLTRNGAREKDRPKIQKTENIEATGTKKQTIERITGFEHLI